MTKITREELLKIAALSKVSLAEEEIPVLLKQLQDLLTYAERVGEVAAEVEEPSNKNVNVFREDVIVRTNVQPTLRQAPQVEENSFIVPKVLESNE